MNDDKELDLFIKKMVKEAGLDAPSEQLTSRVLQSIEQLNLPVSTTTYKPLISNTFWGFLGTVLVGIILYVAFENTDQGISFLYTMNFDFLTKYEGYIASLNSVLSETLWYSIIGLILFFYIQLFILKRYMDHRIRFS
ncbi:hypothetical protein U1E44_15695 [Arenibacter sp. GZD96]|uniref:hypothetical protein n=1 Tax=Aurantibrevibacter litoralis TaxID=3106030 RepID=UPI002AFEF06B|nr:hypothetical protein [Arenibacter sp. GZD-96]MEA1787545.1 hypothetical protein [Arenibacter sp. GZD-96]